MIKKLRRKFVIINMSLVAVILCVVLGMFCFTRIHAFRAESEIAIRHSVHNTGKAIPEEDLPHLFERFYRGKNASPDSVGIGLALSKSIIEKNGGIVDVKSQPGCGSRFSIRLYHGVV